jgi:hypothetical protein
MKLSPLQRLLPRPLRLRRLRREILDYYSHLPPEAVDAEAAEVLSWLRRHPLGVFPYDFAEAYHQLDIPLHRDSGNGLFYTLWEDKRLYYGEGGSKRRARRYFRSLHLEQDVRSPHRYLTAAFDVREGDVVVDVGAAEGNFALSVVERAGHVWLLEPGPEWSRALEATFAPWSHKVTIVPVLAGDRDEGPYTSLDRLLAAEGRVDFIKADVEGAEGAVIRGAAQTIGRNRGIRLAVCTYHRQRDAAELSALIQGLGMSVEYSSGYLIFHYGRDNEVRPPYLRKALIRAQHTSQTPWHDPG